MFFYIKNTMSIVKKIGKDHLTIVAFGDSLTYGWDVPMGYLKYLNIMLKTKYPDHSFSIINSGIPGNTAAHGLDRIKKDVIDRKPDIVLIQFGINDAFMNIHMTDFSQNILSIAKIIKDETKGIPVVVTSTFTNDSLLNKEIACYYYTMSECSQRINLPIAMVHEYWAKRTNKTEDVDKMLLPDGVHPTLKGHELMAEAILEVL